MEEFNFDAFESYAKIVVIGVGGAGNNAVNRMIDDKISNIDFWVCNTDAQTLSNSKAGHKFVLGSEITRGLGAGGNPEIGEKAAQASIDDIKQIVDGADMVFIAAGMGGGTGTGAAPVIAQAAREAGALTLAIVTRPFTFEGQKRRANALEGISKLKDAVDAYIIVSNDRLLIRDDNGSRSLSDAFKEADKVLSQSVRTITDLITIPGIINLDFADVKNILTGQGLSLIGTGVGSGEKKAIEAATQAIFSPLIETPMQGAKSMIINITVGKEATMYDIQDAISYITEESGKTTNIIFGVQQNDELKDEMIVSVVATEFDEEAIEANPTPVISRINQIHTSHEEDEDENILPDFIKKEEKNDRV